MAKIRIIKRYDTGGVAVPSAMEEETINVFDQQGNALSKSQLGNILGLGTQALTSISAGNPTASKVIGSIGTGAQIGNTILPGGIGAGIGAAAGTVYGAFQARKDALEQQKLNKQQHMAFMDKNVSYGQDMGLNPFISALGGTIPKFALGSVEAQLDEGEMISTPEGHLYPTKSKDMHEQMGPNEKTDDLKKGSFVYSNRNGLLWREIEEVAAIAEQQLGIKLNTQILKTYAKDKGRTTPADMAANIEKGLQRKPTPGKHGEATSKRNEQVKAMMLAEVQKYNDVLKALTEGAQEPAVPQMPQQMQQVMAKYGGYINKYASGSTVDACAECDKAGGKRWIADSTNSFQTKGDEVCEFPDGSFVNCTSGATRGTDKTRGPKGTRKRKPADGVAKCPQGTVVVWSEDGETYQCWDPKDINKGKDGTPAPGNTPGQPKLPGGNTPNTPGEPPTAPPMQPLPKDVEAIPQNPTFPFPGPPPLNPTPPSGTAKDCVAECYKLDPTGANLNLVADCIAKCSKASLPNSGFKTGEVTDETEECRVCMQTALASNSDVNAAKQTCAEICNKAAGKKQGGGSPFGYMAATNAASAIGQQSQRMYDYVPLNEQPTRDMKTKIPMDGIVNQINRGARNSAQSMPGAPWQPTMANLQAIHGQKSNQIGEVAGQVGKMNVDLFNQQKGMLQSLAGQNQLTRQAWEVDQEKLNNLKRQAPFEAGQKTMESFMDYYKSMAANEMQSAYIKAMLQQMGMDPNEMGFNGSKGFSLFGA